MDATRAWDIHDVTLPDGRRLRMRCWPGRGRALVLLHGLFDDADARDALARDTHRPCYAVDVPGFGASDGPTRPRVAPTPRIWSTACRRSASRSAGEEHASGGAARADADAEAA